MTTRKYSSRSQQTTLTAGINSTDTSATVVSGTALLGGVTISAGQTFTVVIDPDTALEEIVDVTAVSTNTLTITRGIDGSSGQSHSAGAVVRHMAIGRDYREANTHIEASAGVHGITGSVVGTTDTQTLTNKTLTTPTIASFTNATHNHTNAAGGGTLTSAAITDFTEAAQDAVGDMFSGNTESGIAVTYDDATNKVNFDVNDPVISIDGDIAGSATMTNLGNVTINTGITAGVIVNADISGAAAIAASKISGTAVTQADTGTVTSTMIADGTIVNGDISASAAIDKTKISGTAITAGDTGTVTSTMIADGTIVNGDINASAGIAYSKLNLTGGVVNADIASGAAIALSKLATDPLARANHTGTQTASTISDFNTTVRANRLDQMAAPTTDVSLATYKITNLGTPSASTDASTKGYVDSQITALIGGAPSTLDTLKEIADAIANNGSFATSVVLRDGTLAMTGNLQMGTNKVTNLGNPTANQDAATKYYVDNIVLAPSNLTGPITSIGNATSIASQTGTGTKFVVDTSPTIITPTLSNPAFSGQVSTDIELGAGRSLVFEGTTDNTYETTLTVADPTADRTVTIPDASTTLVGTDVNQTLTNKTIDASSNTLTNVSLSSAVTGTLPIANGGTGQTTANAALNALLPSQASNANKYLKTDGTNTSWTTVDALPSQTGNSGKYLTTNGTSASWASIVTDPTPSVFMLMGA